MAPLMEIVSSSATLPKPVCFRVFPFYTYRNTCTRQNVCSRAYSEKMHIRIVHLHACVDRDRRPISKSWRLLAGEQYTTFTDRPLPIHVYRIYIVCTAETVPRLRVANESFAILTEVHY
uniref:Uncharacterized protein n=1 Tax=Sipha flava TaxID=143950 RepID=A0A2S2R8J6_9HEMI